MTDPKRPSSTHYIQPNPKEEGAAAAGFFFGLAKLWLLGWIVGTLLACSAILAFGWVAWHFIAKVW